MERDLAKVEAAGSSPVSRFFYALFSYCQANETISQILRNFGTFYLEIPIAFRYNRTCLLRAKSQADRVFSCRRS